MAEQTPQVPCVRAVHADPNCRSLDIDPLPKSARRPAETKSPAKWAYERLILYIKNFEEQLDGDHEIAMGFTGSSAGVLRIEGIGYFDPDIVTFYGSDAEGTRTQLIQHVSQLNVILRALQKQPEAVEARRIGFRLAQELDENEAG
ncbi:MAG: DUF6173 family protein [Tropicimonas sp.]|uniref:DUF6173 family protein n=1 Tax=Tropicimonas sp. TaxID=2067044 RepID=UPI003A8BADBC